MKKLFSWISIISLITLFIHTQPSNAATGTLKLAISQNPSASESIVTLYGTLKPAKSGTEINIQINTDGSWKATRFKTKSTRIGTYKVVALATALDAQVKYRATAYVGKKRIYSNIRSITIQQLPEISTENPEAFIDAMGPGSRIHGADISRWQHPNDKPIDFATMYSAGIRFVMIKASDTRDDADALSLKYLAMDHSAAQAAGIYTGFYHYTILPDTAVPDEITKDARAQAQKVIWRLASIGGYGEKDLPYALDLENNCVRLNSNKTCAKYASRSAVTLWATTFLSLLKEKTGRTPFIYSYPNFLESAMTRSSELAQYPLWLAQYAIDPADPLAQPGLKNGGCFVHSWTTSNCSSSWTVWQYTSCGIATKYGVPGTRVDLNIFRGSPNIFLNLTKGSWVPEAMDFMPLNEPTQLTVNKMSASTTDKLVTFNVSVNRPNLNPVVTGSVKFIFDPLTPASPKPTQTVLRSSSGIWTLALKGVPAGVYQGLVTYVDVSNTHATSSTPAIFTVTQGVEPSPTPVKPSPNPTIKPVTDGCANQIKN
jgi:GH25 family lysozyme M1 (1,4-beta-N-acetylmuramidase)